MIAIFIYNIFLILLYAFSLSIVGLDNYKEKKPIFAALGVLLTFFILDNVIIYMTEFINSFAHFYDRLFLVVPIIKAAIYLVNNYCCIWIVNIISDQKLKKSQMTILIGLGLWILLTPMLPASALSVWLFYLPNQLFLIYIGITAWRQFRKQTDNDTARYYLQRIALLCIIAGIIILVEDTYVIFNVDQYSSLTLKIFNRNFSEDIFSIAACFFILQYSLKIFLAKPTVIEVAIPTSNNPKLLANFSEHYQFTQRETEIFELLLSGKSNQEIADVLFLSIGTVKTHVHNIFIKLDINRRNQIDGVYQKFIENS